MASSQDTPLSSQRHEFPPLPDRGPEEISELAQRNFAQRQRLYWLKRLLPVYWFNSNVTPIENGRRERIKRPFRKLWTGKWHVDAVGWGRDESPSPTQEQEAEITLANEDSEVDATREEHLFRWAIVMEHQRGNVPFLFFLPKKYSSGLLIFNDPPPFTIVSPDSPLHYQGSSSGDDRVDFSLEEYPLPDGNWRWASKQWMVDMREGHVQYDGFEYNWSFRPHGWRSKASSLGSGAWVRRRRWVRLMERPPLSTVKEIIVTPDPVKTQPDSTTIPEGIRVWHGDEDDWGRVHDLMRRLGRDGRKLEVWKRWISPTPHMLGSRFRHKQWSEDEDYMPSEIVRDRAAADVTEALTVERPDPDAVAKVLHSHGDDILRLFIYPGSRLEFLQLVKAAGFAPDLLAAPMQAPVPFVEEMQIHELISENVVEAKASRKGDMDLYIQ